MKRFLAILFAPLLALAQPTPPTSAALNVNKTTGAIQNNQFDAAAFKSANGIGGGGTGDVVGPSSATDNALVRFDSTTGKSIQNSVGILSDTGALSGLISLNGLSITAATSNTFWAGPATGSSGALVTRSIVPKDIATTIVPYNVRAYGAVGNGTADDAAAIGSAITAAGTYSTVYFPLGDYAISTAIAPLTGQTFKFEQGAILRIIPSGAFTGAPLVNSAVSNFTIRGATFRGRATANGVYAVLFGGSANRMIDCHMDDQQLARLVIIVQANYAQVLDSSCTGTGPLGYAGSQIEVNDSSYAVVSRCTLSGAGYAIDLFGGSLPCYGVQVTNNTVNLATSGVVLGGVEGALIANNSFRRTIWLGVLIASQTQEGSRTSDRNLVIGNYFEDCGSDPNYYPIYVDSGRQNQIVNNTIITTDPAINGGNTALLVNSGIGHLIQGNVISNAVRFGIGVASGATDIQVVSNSILNPGQGSGGNNSFGILTSSSGGKFMLNRIVDTRGGSAKLYDGIQADSSSSSNNFIENTASGFSNAAFDNAGAASNYNIPLSPTTGSGNLVYSGSPTFSGTVIMPAVTANVINSSAGTALTLGTTSFGPSVSVASATGIPTFNTAVNVTGQITGSAATNVFQNNQNAETSLRVLNSTNGTGANALLVVGSSIGNFNLYQTSALWSASSRYPAGTTIFDAAASAIQVNTFGVKAAVFDGSQGLAIYGTTEATTGGAGALTSAGGIYSAKKIVTSTQLVSNVATGTPPLVIASTDLVANLHAATADSSTTTTTATNATNTAITDDTTTNATTYPTWVTANTGNLPQKVSSTKLSFNPSTGAFSSTSFIGAGTGLTGTAASLTAGSVTTNANLTGDVTSVGNGTTLANIPTATPMAGSVLATAIVAPSTPASGKGSIYVDSTSKNISVKDDAGTVKHGVQTKAAVTSNFVTAISDAGVVSVAQPAQSDVTGLTTADSPQFTAVNIGNASDTTLTRLSAGVAAIEGATVFTSTTKADVLEAAIFAADAGSTDAYAITLSPAITAYVTGAHYWFKANTANTGAATININSVGAKTIVKVAGGITTTLADNDIRSGQWVDLVYDGTNMQMQSLLGNAGGGGGTPGGSNLDIQYNNSGSFGGYTPATGIATFLTTAVIPAAATATTQTAGYSTTTAPATVGYADRDSQLQYNAQTGTTYTLVLTDGTPGSTTAGVSLSNASAVTLTVPTNASVAFPTGWTIPLLSLGAGAVTIAPAGGVTINSPGGLLTIGTQNGTAVLNKTGTNTWQVYGLGSLPAVVSGPRLTGQTAAASLTAYTVGAADSSFLVSANVLVTTSTVHSFTTTCTYSDEGNTSRTLTLTFSNVGGTLVTAIANAAGAVPYEGVPLHIRAKAATTITFATVGTFTTVTYNVEGVVTQIK